MKDKELEICPGREHGRKEKRELERKARARTREGSFVTEGEGRHSSCGGGE